MGSKESPTGIMDNVGKLGGMALGIYKNGLFGPFGSPESSSVPKHSSHNSIVNGECSPPPTTELGEQSTQTEDSSQNIKAENDEIARELALDIVQYMGCQQQMSHSQRASKYTKTLRRTVEEITRRHDILFVNIIDRFQINHETGKESFTAIADEMLSDGQVNWGRVVTVYALGAHFARYSAENNMADYVHEIGCYLGDYIALKLGRWITDNGGWESFCNFFPEKPNIEEKIWNGLWVAVAGLGALAALAAVR